MKTLPLDILYEDADIVAVNKPSGMPVHPSPGHEAGALSDALVARCPSIANVGSHDRPGIVHRLDIETSGALVAAKTQRAYIALRQAFETHDIVRKVYLAVLHGAPNPRTGELETLIGRKAWDARRMAVVEHDGKPAKTLWRTLGRNGPLALVEFTILTGRTHQIRVHSAYLGHPIVGDTLYGDAVRDRRLAVRPRRLLLHAAMLEFPHPVTGRRITVAAPPPPDIVFAH